LVDHVADAGEAEGASDAVCVVNNCSDTYDSDSSGGPSDDDSHPQTKDELMSKAMKSVVKRESALKKQDQFELSDVPDRSKKERHHKQQKAIKA